VIALIVFVLRPMLSARPADRLAELAGPRDEAGDAGRHLTGEARQGDLLELPPHTVTKIERLREVVTSRGDESAAVLRSWIESPEAQKERAGT